MKLLYTTVVFFVLKLLISNQSAYIMMIEKNIFTCITYMILIEPLNVCRFLILVNVDSLTDPGLLMNLHLNRSTKTVQKRNQTHN